MRKLTGMLLVLVLVLGTAGPTAANNGALVEGLWLARDNVDGSRMLLEITELTDGSGFFNVVFTDTRATAGCVPRPARFRAVSNSGTFDPGLPPSPHGPRFFVVFDASAGDQIRCFGRSVPAIDFFELQLCFENDPVHCTDPVDPDPNIAIDLILDVNEQPITEPPGNLWFHIHG